MGQELGGVGRGARSCEEAHFVPGSILASVCSIPLQSQFISIKLIHGNDKSDSVSSLLVRSSRTVFRSFAGVKNLVLFLVFAVVHK